MKFTVFRLYVHYLWHRETHFNNFRSLTRHRTLHNNAIKHNLSMPPKNPPKEGVEQDTIQDTHKTARDSRRTSQPGQGRVLRPRAGKATQHKDNGDSSLPDSQQQQPFHKSNSKPNPPRRRGPGNSSIHSTATSTRPSYRNNQWRSHSSQPQPQQTTPTDTEDLTQALAQLTTQDTSHSTTTITEPTKSRWRTAKPRQQPSNNATTSKPANPTKTQSHNSNAKGSQSQTTQTRAKQASRTPDKTRGMIIGFPSFMAW